MTAARAPVLPLAYYEGFLDALMADERIRVITFADLAWTRLDRRDKHYPREWKRWQKRADRDAIYVLLQHDVDAAPERTTAVLRLEAERGLRSNVMVFNRRHDRPRLAQEGALEFTPYDIDVPLLQELEREGFVVGYHCSAVEQALWDLERARAVFADDVRELRKHFDIRFFNPHGGVPGPAGVNNNSIDPPRVGVRWVSNRFGARFNAAYSDGRLTARSLDELDLRAFVRTWKPGKRYRILTHPQYYGATEPLEQFRDVEWYAALFDVSTRPSG